MPGDEDVSTRIDGALPPVIRITAKATLAAGDEYLILTVTEENTGLWRYSLSGPGRGRSSRDAFGRIISPGYTSALHSAAEICADGYQPGSTEHGLLDSLARDTWPATPAGTAPHDGEDRQ
jgi:hypothetical protein